MLNVTLQSSDNNKLSHQFINAFWLAGLFLDIFGAFSATLAARWFEVLDVEDVKHLHDMWETEKDQLPIPSRQATYSRKHIYWMVDYIVSIALFSGMGVVAMGTAMFLIGLLIFVWAQQPLLVSIISTVPCVVMVPLMGSFFIPHANGKKNIIEILARKRGAW